MTEGTDCVAKARRARAAAFERFAEGECARSPLYRRLVLGVAQDSDLIRLAHHGTHGPTPNLILAAVHYPLLAQPRHLLADHYPTIAGRPNRNSDPVAAFRDFALERAEEIQEVAATRYVQTNEAGRAAILAPAILAIATENAGRVSALIEIGASAGLLPNWDRYGVLHSDGTRSGPDDAEVTVRCAVRGDGQLPDLGRNVAIASRTGIDLRALSRDGRLFRLSLESIGVERDGRANLIEYRDGEVESCRPLAPYDPHGAWIEWLAG